MTLYTEQEARGKWCPFARVYENASGGPAHNRVQKKQGSDVFFPVGCLCIASDCMAWRWNEKDHDAGGFKTNDKTPPRGYCGLAGKVQP